MNTIVFILILSLFFQFLPSSNNLSGYIAIDPPNQNNPCTFSRPVSTVTPPTLMQSKSFRPKLPFPPMRLQQPFMQLNRINVARILHHDCRRQRKQFSALSGVQARIAALSGLPSSRRSINFTIMIRIVRVVCRLDRA